MLTRINLILQEKAQGSRGKSAQKLAQDLVAKKCGILQSDDSLEDTTLQDYLDMYKKPLSDDSMQAILQLTEVAVEKKKKKKTKDKKTLTKSHNKFLAAGKMVLAKKKSQKKMKESVPAGILA
jgi:sugar diacid utilization regulator